MTTQWSWHHTIYTSAYSSPYMLDKKIKSTASSYSRRVSPSLLVILFGGKQLPCTRNSSTEKFKSKELRASTQESHSIQMTTPRSTSWLLSRKTFWARTTQLSHSLIPNLCKKLKCIPFFFFFFLVGLEFGLCFWKAITLPLESHLQSSLLMLVWRWGSLKLFIQAALQSRSSWTQPPKQLRLQDSRHEPTVPSSKVYSC
jgi:hypothetical protein